ncbi:MAG TPA: HemK/PrmC family methyltransferase, partial [Actinomycetes bacterium]|nr:HemK/PrmC family methyltransferase [Actinomycetes bacterium]
MLSSSGVNSPRVDAELLAAHLLRIERSQLWLHQEDPPPAGFFDLVKRRAARVPLQHITGEAFFRTLTLCVGPGVFIPRPETEVVVDKALDLLDKTSAPAPVVVDLCAGSGAIAISIATERPGVEVHAV